MVSSLRSSTVSNQPSKAVLIQLIDHLAFARVIIKNPSSVLAKRDVDIIWHYISKSARFIYKYMKQGQENSEKSEDYQVLINQEYGLVVDGKAADRLVKLFRDYETDPFTIRIEKVQGNIEKYAHALLINGQYLDLTFLLQRYKNVAGVIIKNSDILLKIGDFGKRQDLKGLWEQVRLFAGQVGGNAPLGQRIVEATIDNTLKVLSKYFLNFSIEDLTKITGITEKDLVGRGAGVEGKFVHLKQEVIQSDCLQSKLKEIAVVASRMSQFE